ncbi:hypothetical protein V1511DRAFT_457844 [Dipodascopsis uninucleata]
MSRRHERTSSVTLHAVPSQIILPFVDRPEELADLRSHHENFFNMVKSSVGPSTYENQLIPILESPRNRFDDISLLNTVHKILCPNDESSSCLWANFCSLVGCDPNNYVDDSSTSSSPPSDFMASQSTTSGISPPSFKVSMFDRSHRNSYDYNSNFGQSCSPTLRYMHPTLEEEE